MSAIPKPSTDPVVLLAALRELSECHSEIYAAEGDSFAIADIEEEMDYLGGHYHLITGRNWRLEPA